MKTGRVFIITCCCLFAFASLNFSPAAKNVSTWFVSLGKKELLSYANASKQGGLVMIHQKTLRESDTLIINGFNCGGDNETYWTETFTVKNEAQKNLFEITKVEKGTNGYYMCIPFKKILFLDEFLKGEIIDCALTGKHVHVTWKMKLTKGK